jgi:hypothetical protein
MDENMYRQILKKRALDRWENEGGRAYADPRVEQAEFLQTSERGHYSTGNSKVGEPTDQVVNKEVTYEN